MAMNYSVILFLSLFFITLSASSRLTPSKGGQLLASDLDPFSPSSGHHERPSKPMSSESHLMTSSSPSSRPSPSSSPSPRPSHRPHKSADLSAESTEILPSNGGKRMPSKQVDASSSSGTSNLKYTGSHLMSSSSPSPMSRSSPRPQKSADEEQSAESDGRGILSNLFGLSSNSSGIGNQAMASSSPSPSSLGSVPEASAGTSVSAPHEAIHRHPRSANGYQRYGAHPVHKSHGYPRPQYHYCPETTTTTTTTTTTPPPKKVIICIVDGKVVELDSKWKSCPSTTTTTTTVKPKIHFEQKPHEVHTQKPLKDDPFNLTKLFHH